MSSDSNDNDKLTEQQVKDILIRLGILLPTEQQVQDAINRMNKTIVTEQQINDMKESDGKVVPTEQQINDMQRRMGVIPSGNFDETKKGLDETIRFRPKIIQKLLGMTSDDYNLFGLEPSENL